MTVNQLNKKFKLRSDKLALFCMEYVKDLNGKQAAIRAGYSKKTAPTIASENLIKPNVLECLSFLQKKTNETLEYSAEDLKQSLIAVEEMDVTDILNDDGSIKPVSGWPKVWRTNISAFDVTQLLQADGEEALQTVISKIKWPDKTKNRELLGRHIDIQAWRETLKIENEGLAERMARARKNSK